MHAALILVKLDSEGPAIFAHERMGLNKRPFRVCRFRRMVTNAEKLKAQLEPCNEAQGLVFKLKHDPRITRIGRFLPKSSIGELPQLFNVLKGEMSLVGPRPLPLRDYMGPNHDWQRRRFSLLPGIRCLWQVSGRCNISFDHWMRLDMEYMDHWFLWPDMKILAKNDPRYRPGAPERIDMTHTTGASVATTAKRASHSVNSVTLDQWRAIALILVLISHGLYFTNLVNGVGRVGVNLFFSISRILPCRSLDRPCIDPGSRTFTY